MKAKIVIVLGLLLLGGLPLFAAFNAYLKIDGIPGESTNPGHTGWIEVMSFSWGVTPAGTMAHGSGGGEGKASLHDLSITKNIDKSSPVLMQACANGRHFPKVTLELNGQRYELQDVVFTSSQRSSMGDGSMREVVKMSFVRDALHPEPPNPVGGAALNARAAVLTQPNATFTGGVNGGVMLQSLKLVGQTQAIIVVCDVNGGQSVAALQRASQSRQPMPTLSIRANPKQPGQAYMTFTFTNVMVSSSSAAPGGCSQFTLNFAHFDGPAGGY